MTVLSGEEVNHFNAIARSINPVAPVPIADVAGVVAPFAVIPAKAGIHSMSPSAIASSDFGKVSWVPACAGMTVLSGEEVNHFNAIARSINPVAPVPMANVAGVVAPFAVIPAKAGTHSMSP
jgi:hypothetical protein